MILEKSCGAVVFAEINGVRHYLIEEMQRGHFSIPKGHVEQGETERETAEREIREETGLVVSVNTAFRTTSEYSPYSGCMKTVVFFVARASSTATVAQPEEVSRILWLPFEKARARLNFDDDKRVLSEAEAWLNANKS